MRYNSRSFSNKKLESLSKNLKRFEKGYTPWVNYSSELYSHGKSFREFANYSKFLPLCIHSDHGVSIQSNYIDYEKSTNLPFLTWNYSKYLEIKKTGREVYYVQNPWINYRRKKFNNKKKIQKRGTIIFFPKSISGVKVELKDLNKYISSIKKLPKKCQPISICLSFYDINYYNLHKKLRKYGLNLVTVGNSSSQNFIDRFYKLISKFKYASAPLGARPLSGFFYCIEYGLPFFFHGRNIKYKSDGSRSVFEGWKKGNIKHNNILMHKNKTKGEAEKVRKITKKFFKIKDQVDKDQKDLISPYLGLNSNVSKLKLKYIFIKALILNFYKVILVYYHGVIKQKF